jgi:hypothetical protein
MTTLNLVGSQLTIAPGAGTSGSFVVNVSASNGTQSSSETFKVIVHTNDQRPVLASIPDQSFSRFVGELLTLQGSDPDGDTLTYSATGQTQAYWLKQTYGLYQDPGGFFTNARGQQEKYLRGKVSVDGYTNGGGDFWYYILPSGDLYEFTPSYTNPVLTGALVAHLGTSFYTDPTLLTNAANTAVALSLIVSGNVLSILPTGLVPETFVVIATVSDVLLSSSKAFRVTVS